MSTYSLAVSGPSPTLAYLRALALKASRTTGKFLTAVRLSLATGGRLIRTTATTALAVIGSDTGYDLARRGIHTLVTATAGIVGKGLRLLGRGIKALGRLARKALGVVSPSAAATANELARTWILQPIANAFDTAASWARTTVEVLWHLTGTSLVRRVTVTAAQTASILLGVHALTHGALAARLVMALPAAMTVAAWITQPINALMLVAGAFAASTVLAGVLLARQVNTPSPREPQAQSELIDPGTPDLIAERPRPLAVAELNKVAASLNVEIAPDGSVLVHGVPDDLPADAAREIAGIAADAAADRLRRILLHRPLPNRDDRRLITKVAREAVRSRGGRPARTA